MKKKEEEKRWWQELEPRRVKALGIKTQDGHKYSQVEVAIQVVRARADIQIQVEKKHNAMNSMVQLSKVYKNEMVVHQSDPLEMIVDLCS